MKWLIVTCILLVACGDLEPSGAVPPGADRALVPLSGRWTWGSYVEISDHCKGTLPYLYAVTFARDGVAELEAENVHLARWRRTIDGGFTLTPMHGYGWWAESARFKPDGHGGYEAVIDWLGSADGLPGECLITTRLEPFDG